MVIFLLRLSGSVGGCLLHLMFQSGCFVEVVGRLRKCVPTAFHCLDTTEAPLVLPVSDKTS